MALTDGLVVSLGGDDGDSLIFTNADSFTLSDATLSDSMLDFISEFNGILNIDVDNLIAFESNFGDTVWTDVDMLA